MTPAGAPTAPAPQDPEANGHWVLVVEGNVERLAVTAAIPKPDPWAGTPTGLQSPFTLRLLDGKGALLQAVPVDLSRFDTDPAHIGKPVAVTGCVVRDSRIGLLVNVPQLQGLRRFEFWRDAARIGATDLLALPPAAKAGR